MLCFYLRVYFDFVASLVKVSQKILKFSGGFFRQSACYSSRNLYVLPRNFSCSQVVNFQIFVAAKVACKTLTCPLVMWNSRYGKVSFIYILRLGRFSMITA